MGFSGEWNGVYSLKQHLSIWPWSDLVSYVMRYVPHIESDMKVLEIGCGAGANIPFFQSLGVQYYAVDGSDNVIEAIKQKYPELADRLVSADFTKTIPFPIHFDLIIDRASLTHNRTNDIRNCLNILKSKLKSGGMYIGIDWFSTEHSDYQKGESVVDDPYTRTNIAEGQFTDLGCVHFSDSTHLLDLFHQYEIVRMEQKTISRKIPDDGHIFASWNFVAVKQ